MPWDSDFDVKLYTEQDITMEGPWGPAGESGGLGAGMMIWVHNDLTRPMMVNGFGESSPCKWPNNSG